MQIVARVFFFLSLCCCVIWLGKLIATNMAAHSSAKCVTCTKEIVGLPCTPILLLDGELSLLLEQEWTETNVDVMSASLSKFYRLVNALINNIGGAIILHSESQYVLEKFDQKVDERLNGLIPDNSFYHEVFERYVHDEKHIIYQISQMPAKRPYSTLDFKSKSSLNKGKAVPTHGQISSFLVQLEKSKKTSTDKSCQNKWKFEHGKPVVDVEGTFQEAFQESTSIQAKAVPDDINDLPEYCFNKAKEYISSFTKLSKGGSIYFGIMEHKVTTEKKVWTAAVQPPFKLASLTQQVQGAGNVSAQEPSNPGRGGEAPGSAGHGRGVADSLNQSAAAGHGRGRSRGRGRGQATSQQPGTPGQAQPATTGTISMGMLSTSAETQRHDTSRAQQSPAVQNNQHVQDMTVSEWKIWQDKDDNDNTTNLPTVYYVSKHSKLQCEKKKNGEFRTQGVLLPQRDRQLFIKEIQERVGNKMMWFGNENPGDIIEVEFHPIENKSVDYCVIELKVGHYHGLCFHDKDGPLAYRAFLQQQSGPDQGQQNVVLVGVKKWITSFVYWAHKDVRTFIGTMEAKTPVFSS